VNTMIKNERNEWETIKKIDSEIKALESGATPIHPQPRPQPIPVVDPIIMPTPTPIVAPISRSEHRSDPAQEAAPQRRSRHAQKSASMPEQPQPIEPHQTKQPIAQPKRPTPKAIPAPTKKTTTLHKKPAPIKKPLAQPNKIPKVKIIVPTTTNQHTVKPHTKRSATVEKTGKTTQQNTGNSRRRYQKTAQ